ncbi:DNA polymerase III subunit beta (plasmid) [Rossellomorea marisflavi]|uniref:DNA polymerase III subunit beta n=1 Tax=Rossellomorea marisflavi TaxID=189381 RepID=UPI00131792B4|nr:DNA polymerase III subunit beta [Rossellomorea marisflavi]QHA38745.1 DNA polymerase III subunit beta [Rossellomorea marisflavi]
MKLTIHKETITEALKKVTRVLASNSAIPILNGVLLEVSNKEVLLTASNSTETIRQTITVDNVSVDVIEPGKIVIPKPVIDIVKKCNKDINFSLNGYSLNVVSGKKTFDFTCLDATDYPKFPDIDLSKPSFVLEGHTFHQLIRKTAYAASNSETRPILTGVCFELAEGNCSMICTDSHRLGRVIQPAASEEKLKIVVPAKAFDTMTKVFDFGQDVEMFIENDLHILIKNNSTTFLSRLLEGTYPDCNRLIPSTNSSVMTINREALFDAIDTLKDIASQSDTSKDTGVVKLNVNGVATFSTANNQKGKGTIEIPYENLEGEDDFTVSFNCKYALDALKSLDSDVVEVSFNGGMRPFLMGPTGDADLEEVHLILPVRTV